MITLRTIWIAFLTLLLALPLLDTVPARAAQGRMFALAIGIGPSYQAPVFRQLHHSEEDARQVALHLSRLGFTVVDQVVGEKATKTGIQQAIDALGKVADSAHDLVVIYYSGHGAVIKGRGRDAPSLVPQDAVPGSKLSFITDEELGSWLKNSLATDQVVLILDSCYSAGMGSGSEKRLIDPEMYRPQQVQARLQAVNQASFVSQYFGPYIMLASSQAQETSKETDLGGVFTHYLLQGMWDETTQTCPACERGQAWVTPAALLKYAADNVPNQVDQQPQLKGNTERAEQLALLVPGPGFKWLQPPSVPSPVQRPSAVVRTTPAPVQSAQPRPGKIVLKLNVSGADITVNGSVVQTGVGPQVMLEDQPEGSYSIEVTKPGYLPKTLTVTLREGDHKTLVANLAPRPAPTGRLTIETDPAGATAEIGGTIYKTPVAGLSLKPGSYTVTIRKKKFQSQDEQVTVEENKENRYSFQLAPLVQTLPTPVPTSEPVVRHTPRPQPSGRLPAGIPRDYFQFARIPPGTFMMGSPANEAGRFDGETQHEVTITRPFEMQTTLVTQALWQAVMGNNPSHFKGADLPVERVSWNDVQMFINKLNQMLGTNVYRLPTEAEWEYAARAGTTTPYAGSLDAMAWYGNNSGNATLDADEIWSTDQANYGKRLQANGNKTHTVAQKQANAWGLYDMHGNVWEWVQDWYAKDYPSGSVTDPSGPSTGSYRVVRGGSWFNYAQYCRSANRRDGVPGFRYTVLGFRLSRSVRP